MGDVITNTIDAQLPQTETLFFFYYNDVLKKAAEYRLAFAQKESENHPALERELPNIWQTAHYCYEQKSWGIVLAFHNALFPFLDLRGYWAQGLTINTWARVAAQSLDDKLNFARLTHDRANLFQQLGDYTIAESTYRDSELAYKILGEEVLALQSRHMLSLVTRAQGRLTEAEYLCKTTVTKAKELGLNNWVAHPLYVQGLLARDQGQFENAQHCIETSLALLFDLEELVMIAQCHHLLGELALLQNDLTKARTEIEMSLQLSHQAGILRRVAATQRLLGDLNRIEGDFIEAEKIYSVALDSITRIGDRQQLARLLLSQAQLKVAQRQTQNAIELFKGAIAACNEIGDVRGITGISILLAQYYLQAGNWLEALHLIETAFKTAWRTHLLQPRLLLGVLRRRGRW